ncbi:MAG: VOC family protein [Candidatus Lokiarchaeota archaeon]|nr:VOC family protein [Candidatus Lokiarchaeota archaeon]
MQLEHFAIASNSEEDSDLFYINLLGMDKVRNFSVSSELMNEFFGIKKEQKIIRYESQNVVAEVFITEDNNTSKDILTHICLIIDNRDDFVNKANTMGYKVTKVLRKDKDTYYLFIKDNYGNVYEIK